MNDWRRYPTATPAEFDLLHAQIQDDMDALQDEEEAASWAITHWNEPLLLYLLPLMTRPHQAGLLLQIYRDHLEAFERYLSLTDSKDRGLLAREAAERRELNLFRKLAGMDPFWEKIHSDKIIEAIAKMPDSMAAEYIWALLARRTIPRGVRVEALGKIGPISRVAVWMAGRDLNEGPRKADWRHPGAWWFMMRHQSPPQLAMPEYQALGVVLPSSLVRYLHQRF